MAKIDPWKPPGANEVEMAAVVACYRQGLEAAKPSEKKTAAAARNEIEEWYKVPKTAGLLARGVGTPVDGILFFRVDGATVRILYVAAREQRKTIGTQLVTALRDLASKKGMKEIRAGMSTLDPRQSAFFAKLGFKAAGDESCGRVEMALPLAAA